MPKTCPKLLVVWAGVGMKNNQALFLCPPGVGIRDPVLYLHWEPLKYSTSAEECLKTIIDRDPCIQIIQCSRGKNPFHLAFKDWFGRSTFGFVSRAPLDFMVDHHFPYHPYLTWPLFVSCLDKAIPGKEVDSRMLPNDFWVPGTVSFLVCCKHPNTSAVPKIHARVPVVFSS